MKKDLDMTKPCYRKQILPVPCPFFISKFHCNRIQLCDDFLFTLLYSLAGYETHEEHKSGKNTIILISQKYYKCTYYRCTAKTATEEQTYKTECCIIPTRQQKSHNFA